MAQRVAGRRHQRFIILRGDPVNDLRLAHPRVGRDCVSSPVSPLFFGVGLLFFRGLWACSSSLGSRLRCSTRVPPGPFSPSLSAGYSTVTVSSGEARP